MKTPGRFALILFLTLFMSVSLFLPQKCSAASVNIYNSLSTVPVGSTITLSIQINTQNTDVNVLTVKINYPFNDLEVVKVDTTKSVIQNNVEENTLPKGTINISRYTPPGESFNGIGEIAKVIFKVLTAGEHTITFEKGSAIYSIKAIDVLNYEGGASILGVDTSKDTPYNTSQPTISPSSNNSDNIYKALQDFSTSGFASFLNELVVIKTYLYIGAALLIVLVSFTLIFIAIKRKRARKISNQITPKNKITNIIITLFLAISFLTFYNTSAKAQTGSLSFSPTTKTVGINTNFTLTVNLNTGEDDINAADVIINYPSDILEFEGFNSAGSVLPNTLSESFTAGAVHIQRYINTQYTGSGELTILTFKALTPGIANLTFNASSSLPTGYDNPADALSSRGTATVTASTSVIIPKTGLIDDIFTQKTIILGSFLIFTGFFFNRLHKKSYKTMEAPL